MKTGGRVLRVVRVEVEVELADGGFVPGHVERDGHILLISTLSLVWSVYIANVVIGAGSTHGG